jgi:hypothetical protein
LHAICNLVAIDSNLVDFVVRLAMCIAVPTHVTIQARIPLRPATTLNPKRLTVNRPVLSDDFAASQGFGKCWRGGVISVIPAIAEAYATTQGGVISVIPAIAEAYATKRGGVISVIPGSGAVRPFRH